MPRRSEAPSDPSLAAAVRRFRSAALHATSPRLGGWSPMPGEPHLEAMRQAHARLAAAADAGRQTITELLADGSREVRLWISTQVLAEGDERGRSVLESLAAGDDRVAGLAKLTLKAHEHGRLACPFGLPR